MSSDAIVSIPEDYDEQLCIDEHNDSYCRVSSSINCTTGVITFDRQAARIRFMPQWLVNLYASASQRLCPGSSV